MIPKTIHYCWFGGKPLPKSAQKYISTWQKFFPGYEIKEWNESNFDVNAIAYTSQAYAMRKYAFVSDYARFWILYNYGGVYFDTDVEVIKPMDEIIANGPFMGCENKWHQGSVADALGVAPGLGMAAERGNPFCKKMLNIYQCTNYVDENGNPSELNIVHHTTRALCLEGLQSTGMPQKCAGFTIYPADYFCPIDYETRKLEISPNTRSIHRYAESWLPRKVKVKNFIFRCIGHRATALLVKLKNAHKHG